MGWTRRAPAPSQPESWSGGYQSAKAVGAGIGGYEELDIQIENRKHETRFVDLERVAGRQTTSGDHHRIGRLRAARECQLRQASVGSDNVIPLQRER